MSASHKYSGPDDPAFSALSLEQRMDAFNAGEIAGQGPPKAGSRDWAHRSEKPLNDDEITHMRALERQLRAFESEGKGHMMSQQKYELGFLLERHKRTAPRSELVSSFEAATVTDSARLAGLRSALAEAEQRQSWVEVASLMSAIAQIEAGLQ